MKIVLKGRQTAVMLPYMQKYCTGNECMSYEHRTMSTTLCNLSSTDGE